MTSQPAHSNGWRLGRFAGVPIIIAPSWLLAAVVITFLFYPMVLGEAPDLGAAGVLVAFVFVLLLFASVLAHELAHTGMARARGVEVQEVVLTVWGGHTQFNSAITSPGTNALIAVVGPLTNGVLALVFWLLYMALPPLTAPIVVMLILSAAWANGFVAIFNAIPGLPLDGGMLLESAIWAGTKDRFRGTIGAGWFGRILAIGVVAWAVLWPVLNGYRLYWFNAIWAVVIAGYLWVGATDAIRGAEQGRTLSVMSVATVARRAIGLNAQDTVADADRAMAATGPAEIVVLAPAGGLVGFVDHGAMSHVQPSVRGEIPLDAVATQLPPNAIIGDQLGGVDLARTVSQRAESGPAVVVVNGAGMVVGLLFLSDMITALHSK